MSFKFWSDKEVKIVKNYTAKEIIKHNLLPGRTASMIGAKRSILASEGETIYKKKYVPITSTLKSNTRNNDSYSGTIRFYTPEDDKVIKENSISEAAKLLNRSETAISVRKSYVNRLGDNLTYKVPGKFKNSNVNIVKSTNKDLNLTINEIKLNVTNVKSIFIDKNNIDITTH